ncbi:conserved hypothetical protein [Ricinus communis]|uniref:Uncharacterized protein n=1 Tax=Ricinus communis TaxID=3988 RepID=B9RRP2_RICCO|nr:conserved hypothetical protein [Ricinus communis]
MIITDNKSPSSRPTGLPVAYRPEKAKDQVGHLTTHVITNRSHKNGCWKGPDLGELTDNPRKGKEQMETPTTKDSTPAYVVTMHRFADVIGTDLINLLNMESPTNTSNNTPNSSA